MKMAETLNDISKEFAIIVIKCCDKKKGHYSLIDQFMRSATAIGANVREAHYAHSSADFVSKMQIALKECYETEYWIEVLSSVDILEAEETEKMSSQCGKLRRMLIKSINTVKDKQKEWTNIRPVVGTNDTAKP